MVEKVALLILLQGVEWRHHEPHLVDETCLADVTGKGYVSLMDGVERTAVNAYTHEKWKV